MTRWACKGRWQKQLVNGAGRRSCALQELLGERVVMGSVEETQIMQQLRGTRPAALHVLH